MDTKITEKMLELSSLILDFGRVNRVTFHQDGVFPESDTDHTVALSIVAPALAGKLYKNLDLGLICQFCIVHDLVEVYAGDTDTLVNYDHSNKKEKEDREKESLEKIKNSFGSVFPWVHETIEKYEKLDTPEATFVKAVDKILPKINVLLNKGVSLKKRGLEKKDLETQVANQFASQRKNIESWAKDFPEVVSLWEYFCSAVLVEIGKIY